MSAFRTALAAAALGIASAGAIAVPTAASAAVNDQEPGQFVRTLADTGFGAIRSAGSNRAAARSQFRQILGRYFAIDQIGDRLIRRWRPTITPQQYAAYKAALPNFLIGAYADRLFDYSNADLRIGRVIPRGASAAVATTVTKPGAQPIQAVWTVEKIGGGYKVTNLTVAGINLALTQTADFDSFVQRRGFDALVTFMKSKG